MRGFHLGNRDPRVEPGGFDRAVPKDFLEMSQQRIASQ